MANAVTFDPREIVQQTLLLEAIESARIAICVYDDEGRYVTVNDRACSILGYTREELLEHDVGDFTAGGIDRTVLLSDEHREGVRTVIRKDAILGGATCSDRPDAGPPLQTSQSVCVVRLARIGGVLPASSHRSPTR